MQRNSITLKALDAAKSAVLALDSSGRPVYANRSAEELFRWGHWLRLVRSCVKSGAPIINPQRFGAMLHKLRSGHGDTFMMADTCGDRALLTAVPIESPAPGADSTRAIGLVWLTPERPESDAGRKLASLFGLTDAETRILQHLAQGLELREIAQQLSLSIHTARNQLKSVLRKTGQRSQGRLLALVSRMAAIV
jgi:DNA-binding CsgD family transcriptional regulator